MAIDWSPVVPQQMVPVGTSEMPGFRLSVLRFDLIDPVISGNKWYKLKDNLQAAFEYKKKGILTFGGAYSNHLIATAAAARRFGLESIGIVRGMEIAEQLSPTLTDCQKNGMRLEFVSRADYRRKSDPSFLNALAQQYPDFLILPEGGNNEAGIAGVAKMADLVPQDTDIVVVPVGTGTTFSGLRRALPRRVHLRGFAALKQGDFLRDDIKTMLGAIASERNWELITDFHFGGFARVNAELIDFMNDCYRELNLPLDAVYNAKMMWGIRDMLRQGTWGPYPKVCMIHTGGLQGNRSLADQLCF